jgi:hypothetical protein
MTMDAKTLRDSATPPEGLSGPLTALWHAAQGEWDKAHQLVMDDESKEAAWVHAHLHRVEGDLSNAEYWYRRADRPKSELPIDQEWNEMASAMLLHT